MMKFLATVGFEPTDFIEIKIYDYFRLYFLIKSIYVIVLLNQFFVYVPFPFTMHEVFIFLKSIFGDNFHSFVKNGKDHISYIDQVDLITMYWYAFCLFIYLFVSFFICIYSYKTRKVFYRIPEKLSILEKIGFFIHFILIIFIITMLMLILYYGAVFPDRILFFLDSKIILITAIYIVLLSLFTVFYYLIMQFIAQRNSQVKWF